MGAWIEILSAFIPSRDCEVAPLVGAWIEIIVVLKFVRTYTVAPLVGAWIEIPLCLFWMSCNPSLPLWERGLKYC